MAGSMMERTFRYRERPNVGRGLQGSQRSVGRFSVHHAGCQEALWPNRPLSGDVTCRLGLGA